MTAAAPELLLYKRDDCPYCHKVFDRLRALNMQVATRDIVAEAGARDALVAAGGRAQVPCLVIDGKPMYESDAIIHYLDTRAKRS